MIVVTGRMVQSVRRVLEPPAPPSRSSATRAPWWSPPTATWLRHEPIPLELAREAIAAVQAEGYGLNVYVGDELYVAEVTPEAERYASFQQIELHTVGDRPRLARPGRRRSSSASATPSRSTSSACGCGSSSAAASG